MPRRARRLSESGIYHVMLRGVNRDAIFLEERDFSRFLECLVRTKELSGCLVLAYCLMTNHVHLVVRVADEPIGAVVKRLAVRYAGWFNGRYGRVGHLFQDRFLSRPVDDDAYLLVLVRYVWSNPVKAGLAEAPQDYRWSSRCVLGLQSRIIDESELLRLVSLDALLAVVAGPQPSVFFDPALPIGRRPRFSEAEAASLLARLCGVTSTREFALLDRGQQGEVVLDLRARSMPYAQIARLTGMSTSGVRRLHIASLGSVGDAEPDQEPSPPFRG